MGSPPIADNRFSISNFQYLRLPILPISQIANMANTMAILLCSLASRGLAESGTNALTPAQELATFHLADERLVVELVAAEPNVISPVAIAWDAQGRLFVAEMRDYPNAPAGG